MAVNDDLLRAQVSHQIELQRYTKGVVRQVINLLVESERDVRLQLLDRLDNIKARGYDTGPVTTKRLESLLKSLGKSRAGAYTGIEKNLSSEMIELANYESDYQLNLLDNTLPVKVDLVAPPSELLKNIATRRPFQGRLLKEWVKDLEAYDRKALRDAIKIGMVEGETTQQITSRVKNKLNVSRRHAESITRTAVNHVSNHARSEVATSNVDVIKAEKWVSTLDGRTSPVCQARDGKTFEPGKGPRPPAHIRCRSTMTFITKSWRELGIDLDEAPAGTRASMSGQIPDNLTYKEFLKGQPTKFQDGVLGRSKGKLFRDGNLKLDKFIDHSGKEFTLDQLKNRNPREWSKAFGSGDNSARKSDIDLARSSAIDYVVKNGSRDNIEYAVMYSRLNGKELFKKSGGASSVGFTDSEIRLIEGNTKEGKLELVHNHPRGTALSGPDLIFASRLKLDRITAVGSTLDTEFIARPLTYDYKKVGQAIESAGNRTYKHLYAAIKKRLITTDQANHLHPELINRQMHRAGYIDYTVIKQHKGVESALHRLDNAELELFVEYARGNI